MFALEGEGQERCHRGALRAPREINAGTPNQGRNLIGVWSPSVLCQDRRRRHVSMGERCCSHRSEMRSTVGYRVCLPVVGGRVGCTPTRDRQQQTVRQGGDIWLVRLAEFGQCPVGLRRGIRAAGRLVRARIARPRARAAANDPICPSGSPRTCVRSTTVCRAIAKVKCARHVGSPSMPTFTSAARSSTVVSADTQDWRWCCERSTQSPDTTGGSRGCPVPGLPVGEKPVEVGHVASGGHPPQDLGRRRR